MTNRAQKYFAAKRQRRRGYYCPFPADFNRLSGAIIVDRVGHKIPLITDGEIYDQAALMSILPLPKHWYNEPWPNINTKMYMMMPGEGLQDEHGQPVPVPHIEYYENAVSRMNEIVRAAKPPGRMWNYEALLKFAQEKYPDVSAVDAITKCLEEVSAGSLEIIDNHPVIWASLECRGPLSNSNGGLKKATDQDRAIFEKVRFTAVCPNCKEQAAIKVGNSMCDKCVAELYDEEK